MHTYCFRRTAPRYGYTENVPNAVITSNVPDLALAFLSVLSTLPPSVRCRRPLTRPTRSAGELSLISCLTGKSGTSGAFCFSLFVQHWTRVEVDILSFSARVVASIACLARSNRFYSLVDCTSKSAAAYVFARNCFVVRVAFTQTLKAHHVQGCMIRQDALPST